MESDGTAAGRGSSTVSRWNPTKEQVNFLEGLYSDGIRTPSPDQIQQITARLRTYGHIEGKNVFYWFQNHKARDRQKQKQENTMAYNSYLHRYYQPVPAIINPTPNVYCGGGQYYPQPNGDLNFYPQPSTNKLPLPPPSGSSRRKSRGDKQHRDKSRRSSVSYHDAPRYEPARHSIDGASCSGRTQETLSLFPLHPMATLEEESESQSTDYFTLD